MDLLALVFFVIVALAAWRTFRISPDDALAVAAPGSGPGRSDKSLIALAAKPKADKGGKAGKGPGMEAEKEPALAEKMAGVLSACRGFDPQSFMLSAKEAFERSVSALETLKAEEIKGWTSPAVFASISREIQALKSKGRRVETEIVRFKQVSINDAGVGESSVRLSVVIITEQTAVVRNSAGRVVRGDANRVDEIKDVWVFEKKLSPRDAPWLLVEIADV
ncbi:MAG: Tim44 domain-containing protein [Rickettsiales bacterium]|nr:Tim44 domain-containing protein [Rickettsiales bacterium]